MTDEAQEPYSARRLEERVDALGVRVRRLSGAMTEMVRLAGRYDRGSDRPSPAFAEALRDFERDLGFLSRELERLKALMAAAEG